MRKSRALLAVAALGAGAGLLAGCGDALRAIGMPFRGGFETEPLERLMAPAATPAFRRGDTFEYAFGSGVRQSEMVVGVDGDAVEWVLPDTGATWRTKTGAMFETTRWSGTAAYGSGEQTLNAGAGLFPLSLGKSLRYTAKGKSTAQPEGWTIVWTCTVAAQERLAVRAGTFNTYKVICFREGQKKTYYYAPDIGMYVLRVVVGRNAGTKELVSFRRPPR